MSSNTIYWSDYELNILKTLWETSHIKDIIHHFDNKSKKQIGNKAYHIGLKKKINYSVTKIFWSEEEDNFIREYYPKLNSTKKFSEKFNKTFNKNITTSAIKNRVSFLGVKSMKTLSKWTNNELTILTELWPHIYGGDEEQIINIESILNRKIKSIDAKAYEIGLIKSVEVLEKIKQNKSDMLVHRNKHIIGRDMTYDFAKEEAKKYNSKSEMYRLDNSLYQFIFKNSYWDELCSHMIVGDSFNYPQTFLFNCLKKLFPSSEIRYNDRTAIYPKELDVFLVNEKIAFEYDGLTYHSKYDDIELDKIKDNICKEVGIKLYRIKELNKLNPENNIINILSQFGYDTSIINVDELIKETFSMKYSDEMIFNIVSRYTTLKDFRENESKLYSFITRKGLAKKYLQSLETKISDMTEDCVVDKISECTSKFEFREKFYAYYIKMKKKKFDAAQKLYDSL